MTRSRLGLLSLCAMALGLLAFGATGAQGEVGAKWLVLNKAGELKTGAELHALVNLKTDTEDILHSEILKIKTLFVCLKIELSPNARLQEEGIIGNTVVTNVTTKLKEGRGSDITLRECTTKLNGAAAPECTPEDPVSGPGTILTKLGHALLKLHKSVEGTFDIVKVLPDEGEGIGTISLPPTCPIGTKVPLIGSVALKDCENLALTHLLEHLVEVFAPLTEIWTISKTEEHKVTLLGSAWALLKLEHEGLKWSGDPK